MARKTQAAAARKRGARSRDGESSPTRREKALATRRRVLRAAYDLFCERGYAGATMPMIAERAGVAVQTLYFIFNTKARILEETAGASILGFELWDPRVEQALVDDPRGTFAQLHPWFPAFEAAATQADALRVFVESSVAILERIGPLVIATASAAASEPDLARSSEVAEQRRADGYAFVVERLAKRGKLRPGVSQRRATDILLTILSAETYHQLVAGRGWSRASCLKWFRDVLEQQLLP